MSIAALILAAGESSRLGRSKQLVDWGGRPLLAHVLERVGAWPVDRVVVVLGHQAEEILERVDFGEATVVINYDWEEGIASSLRVGLAALGHDPAVEAALVALGDQPDVPVEAVEAVVAEYRRSGRRAVVPRYRYTRGNPVLLDQSLWTRLMSLEGDTGAKQMLEAHPEWVTEVHLDSLPPRDVDTPDDLAELRPRSTR